MLNDSLFKFYSPLLSDDVIHASFQTLLSKFRQSRSDAKGVLDDLSEKIARARSDDNIDDPPPPTPSRGHKNGARPSLRSENASPNVSC